MDYTKVRLTADNKITSFGDDIIVRCTTYGTYDPVSDTYATSSTSYNGKCVITNFSKRDIDGTLVQVGDRRLLLSALDMDGETLPELEGRDDLQFVYNSRVLNVLGIDSLKPGGTVLLYKLHIRG